MPVLDILPTPLYVEECPFHDQNKQLFNQELLTILSEGKENISAKGLYHFDYYCILDNDNYSKFKSWVETQAEIFVRDVLGYHLPESESMMVTDSWFNLCAKDGYQYPHHHANSLVCGLYYINFDEENHSPTYFAKSSSLKKFPDGPSLQLNYDKNTRYNQMDQVIGREGVLFLWESQLIHGYKTNEKDNRFTLSMNFMPTAITNGSYGWRVSKLTEKERQKNYSTFVSGKVWDSPDTQ